MFSSLRPHGLYSPWNSPGQNTRVGSLSLLQWSFPTQGSNPGLPPCRQILHQLSHREAHQGTFYILEGYSIKWTSWIKRETPAFINPFLSSSNRECVLIFWPPCMSYLSSPTRDRTCTPCSGSTESYPLAFSGSRRECLRQKGQVIQFQTTTSMQQTPSNTTSGP